MPREMNYIVPRGETWRGCYELARFPAPGDDYSQTPGDYVAGSGERPLKEIRNLAPRPTVASVPRGVLKTNDPKATLPAPGQMCPVQELPTLNTVIQDDVKDAPSEHVAPPTAKIATMTPVKDKSEKFKPFLKLGCALGLTASAIWCGNNDNDEIVFGAGLIVIRLDPATLIQTPLIGHNRTVIGCGYMEKDDVIISAQSDGLVRLWRRQNGQGIICLKSGVVANHIETYQNRFCLIGPNALQQSKSLISIWEYANNQVIQIATACTDQSINCVVFHQPGLKSFVTGGVNGGLKVWRLARGNHLRSASIDFGHYASKLNIVSMQWASEGSILLAAGHNGAMFRIDIDTLSVVEVHQLMLSGQTIAVSAIMLIGDKLLVASGDGTCRMWTPQLSHVHGSIELGGNVISLRRQGQACLVTTDAKSIGRLDFETNQYATYYRAPATSLLACSIAGELIATLSERQVQVWKYRRQCDYYGQQYHYSIVQVMQINGLDIAAISLNANTIALGHHTGKISAYKIDSTSGASQQMLDKDGNDAILDIHFSATGQLYVIDARGEMVCFGVTLAVSRHVRRGANRHPANHIVSSPCGRFVAVLSFESNMIVQLYSSQLDPLVELGVGQTLVDYYFVGVQTLLLIDNDKRITMCNIGESNTTTVAKDIHFTSKRITARYLDTARLHVTCCEDQLRVWPNNFVSNFKQDYLAHLDIVAMDANQANLVTVGDTGLVWNINGEANGRDMRLRQETALLKYHEQKLSERLNLDETITVEKKSLFSVLNEDDTNCDLSVQEPRPTAPPSPIPFEPSLDITPPHQCSSPMPPPITAHVEQVAEPSPLDHSVVRVIRHHGKSDEDDNVPEAKSVVFTQNGVTRFDPCHLSLPAQISQPHQGAEAITLRRVVSSHCPTQWAPNRGKLLYGSGSQFCLEELDSGLQKRIYLDGGHISTLAIAPDEITCVVFVTTMRGNEGYMIDLEGETKRGYSINTKPHKEAITQARISRDSKYCLSLSGIYDAQLVINNTWNGHHAADVALPLQIADFAWSSGTRFITVGSDIVVWSLVFDSTGTTIVELSSRTLPLPHIISSHLFTAVGVCSRGERVIVGTRDGLVVTLNLNAPNFEVEHFFTASAEGQPITCVAYFASGRFLTASENNVVFWVKRAVTLTGAKGTYDGNGLFVTDDEFELDAPCVAAQVTIDDETSDEMAVCSTSSGTVVFCAAETLATLVASTDQCSCMAMDKVHTVTGHSNGALKVWNKINNENYKLLIHFQAAEPLNTCAIESNTIVAGYDAGIVRLFDIVEGQMTLKLTVPQITSDVAICSLKFVPGAFIAGSSDGRVYLYERNGGLQRQFNDHFKSGPITAIDYDGALDHFQHLTLGGELWLVASEQRKISIWTSVWERRGTHHLAAWITFPGTDRCEARFSRTEPDHVYYWTRQMFFIHSLKGQTVVKQLSLPYQTTMLVSHPNSDLFLIASGRLLTLAELSEERFIYQDYPHHTEPIKSALFGEDHALSATSRQLYDWRLN